jgi:AcrR family transcriptional regulator
MSEKTSETTSRWEQRKERTHRRLLEEAGRLFITKGFDAVTVEEIASAADVAKGTFFNYFESKENLLGELLYSRMQSLLTSPPAPEAPADERIRVLLRTLWQELAPYRHLSRRMLAHTMAHPKPEYLPPNQPTAALTLAKLIREGQAQGIFRSDINAEFAGTLLMAYFFRSCVMEIGAAEAGPADPTMLCGHDLIHEGLDLLYRGMLANANAGAVDSETTD